MNGDARWWEEAFGADYLAVYAHRDDEAAEREAAFAARTLGGVGGCLVLDAGCGAGRHARALARRGAAVVGLDRSAALLAAAAASSGGGGVAFVRADLRALPFRDAAFDAVVSFFTSFGYFDESGDRAQLGEFRRVLRPAGALLLDFLNAPRTFAALVPSSERTVGNRVVREERSVRAGRVEKAVEVTEAGRVVASWRESVRLYERDEVLALLAGAGLRVRGEFGDLDGAPWTPSAPRLVVRAASP